MKAIVDTETNHIWAAPCWVVEGGEIMTCMIQSGDDGQVPYTALKENIFTHQH